MTAPPSPTLGDVIERLRRGRPALLALLGVRLVGGWLVALPLVAVIRAAVADQPHGDAVLFEPGGELLVETVRLYGAELRTATTASLRIALVVAALSLVPLAALLDGWRRPRRRWWAVWGRALARWPAFAAISGTAALGQALVLGAGVALLPVTRAIAAGLGERASDIATLTVLGLATALAASASLAADLARIGAVNARREGLLGAVQAALGVAQQAPTPHVLRWLGSRLAPLAALVAAAALTHQVDVHRPETWRWAAVGLAHAGVIVIDLAARATWLAWAASAVEARLRTWR